MKQVSAGGPSRAGFLLVLVNFFLAYSGPMIFYLPVRSLFGPRLQGRERSVRDDNTGRVSVSLPFLLSDVAYTLPALFPGFLRQISPQGLLPAEPLRPEARQHLFRGVVEHWVLKRSEDEVQREWKCERLA